MAPRAPLRRVPGQPAPYLAPGAANDPRGFGRRFGPYIAPEELANELLREQLENGVVPLEELVAALTAHNLPAQLKQVRFLAFIPGAGPQNAQLLIPMNPERRYGFTVSNPKSINEIVFDYGHPVDMGGGVASGILVAPCYQETNGSVSVDDIWVACNDSTVTFPVPVLGYEGGISISGNKR